MKTILVDAVNTFVLEGGKINQEMHDLLETYPNPKLIVTNANDEQIVEFGLTNLPYELFTMRHQPNKTDPVYFETLFKEKGLSADQVVYFEHNPKAVESARSIGVGAYHYDHVVKDIEALREFLDGNV